MESAKNQSPIGKQCENKKFHGQMKTVFSSFSERPKTMLEVSMETGILRANICRYVGKWRKRDRITVVRFGICPISKHRAGFYTTNVSNDG